MPHSNLNVVFITGNLTRDPELKQTASGTSVAELGVAVNTNVKKDGAWDSKVNFFQVTVWGKQADTVNEHLAKGSKVAITGRLEWQQWENKEGQSNSRVIIVAQQIEFLGPPKKSSSGPGTSSEIPDF